MLKIKAKRVKIPTPATTSFAELKPPICNIGSVAISIKTKPNIRNPAGLKAKAACGESIRLDSANFFELKESCIAKKPPNKIKKI
jgi:hypothetical protein